MTQQEKFVIRLSASRGQPPGESGDGQLSGLTTWWHMPLRFRLLVLGSFIPLSALIADAIFYEHSDVPLALAIFLGLFWPLWTMILYHNWKKRHRSQGES